ncbi:unnamed protein product, partial [Mycena citricolor]
MSVSPQLRAGLPPPKLCQFPSFFCIPHRIWNDNCSEPPVEDACGGQSSLHASRLRSWHSPLLLVVDAPPMTVFRVIFPKFTGRETFSKLTS